MKCPSCKKKNLRKANYCTRCGRKFQKEEKEKQKENIFVCILDKLSFFHDVITLDIIKDNVYLKIISVFVVLAVGIYMVATKGWNLRVLENKVYHVEYNQKLETYYVLLDKKVANKKENEVDVSLYVPNRIQTLDLIYYDEEGNILRQEEHKKKEKYTLTANVKSNNYYILSNHKDAKEKVKIYVYYGEDNDEEEAKS